MDAPRSVLAEAADSLALAVIAASNAPVLLLDDGLTIIAASDTFCDTFAIDSQRTRCLVINARKLDYFDADNVRLLVSAADVTNARINDKLKDDLLHEKAILLQELEHRVANSLQIIASVLMQGAKKVRSQKARGQLRDARNRVMSIATMQRQLAVSRLGDVVLRDYFTDLCDSIGASMISDHDQLSLTVAVDRS